MTAPQRMIVRRNAIKGKDRHLYVGSLVQLADERRDTNGARTWLVLKGPLSGQEIWYRDDQLEACPPSSDPGIDTSKDW